MQPPEVCQEAKVYDGFEKKNQFRNVTCQGRGLRVARHSKGTKAPVIQAQVPSDTGLLDTASGGGITLVYTLAVIHIFFC